MQRIASGADVAATAANTELLAQAHVVLDASDWRIIPAENLIAAFQARRRHPTPIPHAVQGCLPLPCLPR